MRMTVKLFAAARERTRKSEVEFPLVPGMTLGDLGKALSEHCVGFQGITGRWAVNLKFAKTDYQVQAGDEIAFIPPVSGG